MDRCVGSFKKRTPSRISFSLVAPSHMFVPASTSLQLNAMCKKILTFSYHAILVFSPAPAPKDSVRFPLNSLPSLELTHRTHSPRRSAFSCLNPMILKRRSCPCQQIPTDYRARKNVFPYPFVLANTNKHPHSSRHEQTRQTDPYSTVTKNKDNLVFFFFFL